MSVRSIPLFKRCIKCGNEFPATREFFHYADSDKIRLKSDCIQCHKLRCRSPEHKARSRDYYNRNKDRARRYYKANRTRILSRLSMGSDKQAVYRRSRILHKRIENERRRSHKLGLPDTLTPDEWNSCLDYWDYSCAYCGH